MMEQDQIDKLGDELYEALRTQSTVAPLTDRVSDITIEDAYHISLRMVNQRVELDGERIVGKKIGVNRCRKCSAYSSPTSVFSPIPWKARMPPIFPSRAI